MVMMLKLMEKMVVSEIDNLHLRIDELSGRFDALEDRFDRQDRNISILYNSVSDIRAEISDIRAEMVTKTHLDATLKNYPTKVEVEEIVERTVKRLLETYLAPFAKLLEG